MAPKPSNHQNQQKFLILSLLLLSVTLLFITSAFQRDGARPADFRRLQNQTPNYHHRRCHCPSAAATPPKWFGVIAKQFKPRKKIKIGLVNVDECYHHCQMHGLDQETVRVQFERVSPTLEWKHLFPEWIDEAGTHQKPKCPEIPMPEPEKYRDLDLVVAKVPCQNNGTSPWRRDHGIRDVFRLQVNLAVAHLVAASRVGGEEQVVYVVFVGWCEPMWEIFRCDDLMLHEGEFMVYRPDVRKMKEKVMMPVGTCELAAEPNTTESGREAYVTVLHSSEEYVCGAIALAQSILLTNTTKDLVLLADHAISPNSIAGLMAAGWKIKRIERIRSPHAEHDSYNEWNYSKLRVWQLTEYDKLMFIDADFILLRNVDRFFAYPQLSAAPNHLQIFNSGIMIVEPSRCFFNRLMAERYRLSSYNGGDQGFLNEVFTWWHRLTKRLNYLKIYDGGKDGRHAVPEDVYAVHFLGLKPWVCYRDYDCNWDRPSTQVFASDAAHERWWQVHEAMPERLQAYCGLTERMDARIRQWREKARKANLPRGHWMVEVKDPRRYDNSSFL